MAPGNKYIYRRSCVKGYGLSAASAKIFPLASNVVLRATSLRLVVKWSPKDKA
jgi:hypothetical protein